jgi:tetratricopeptide (TPR) repeat protein
MENPSRIGEADHSSIAGFRQSFPYFVPARYLEAYHKHSASPWAPAMLSGVMPYVGNWVLFCDFLNSDTGNYFHNKREKKKTAETDERPILKAQKVITDQKEPAQKVEEAKPETPVAMPVTEVATPIAPELTQEVLPISAQTEVVKETVAATEQKNVVEDTTAMPEQIVEVVQATAPIPEQIVVGNIDEVTVAAEQPEAQVVEEHEEVYYSQDNTVVEDELAEQAWAAELEGTPAIADVIDEYASYIAETEKLANITEETMRPAAAIEIDEEVLEELENRHNEFWIQSEEETESKQPTPEVLLATKDTGNAGVHDVIEQIEDVDDMPHYIPTGNEKPLIYPVYTEDYFLTQGEKISTEMPEEIESLKPVMEATSLMVMMSFSEWLLHFKSTTERQKEENKDQKALKTMWQKEKLAAAIEEENEEIPENVFEMAVNSITKEDGLASEALAEIYLKQGKYDKAVDMYRKLSLRNPQKNAYFARKIEDILKEKQS